MPCAAVVRRCRPPLSSAAVSGSPSDGLELVQPDRTTLSVLRVWVLAWLVIMIIGAVTLGQRWVGAADPFEAYATTVSRLSRQRRSAQRVAVNLSDPLGRGWNLFGTADLAVSTSIFSHPTAVAVVQLGAVVAGQLLGLIAAHEKAVLLAPRHALAGRWPMLDVMLGYTTGLVLLFAP